MRCRFRAWRVIAQLCGAHANAFGARLCALSHWRVRTGAQLRPQCCANCAIRKLALGAPGEWGVLRRSHLGMRARKHRKARICPRYAQHLSPGVTDDAHGLVHHFLHHRLDATAQWALCRFQWN